MKDCIKILFIVFLPFCNVFSADVVALGTFYYKNMFGHIHQNPSRYSVSLTTVSCGHPITVVTPKSDDKKTEGWVMVKAGPYEGYLPENSISDKKVDCFQDRYIKFFDNMDLQLSDMYYWGRFYDQVVEGKSKVR